VRRNILPVATCWQKLDTGPFSILAPLGWEFHQLMGVDSYVGEFVGDGISLTFDFGRYSTELRKVKKPEYIVTKESIGGLSAKVVSPRTTGNGLTGVYFRKIPGHEELCLWGRDLTAAQQELALKMFETISIWRPYASKHYSAAASCKLARKCAVESCLDFSGGQKMNSAANDNRRSSSIMGLWQRGLRPFCYRLLLVYRPAIAGKLLLHQDMKQVLPNLGYRPSPVDR
jgi:hypothetical protein